MPALNAAITIAWVSTNVLCEGAIVDHRQHASEFMYLGGFTA